MKNGKDNGKDQTDAELSPVPKIGEGSSSGIHDFRDPWQPTLTPSGWVIGAILLLLPTIVLWLLHRMGAWPSPCKYYAIWTVVLLVAGVCTRMAVLSN